MPAPEKVFCLPLEIPFHPKERTGVRSNRGSPDACRLFGGRKTVGRAVWRWRKVTTRERTRWRAEVGPRLPGGRPRLLWLLASAKGSFERLVFAEVGNRETQRIDGDQLVGHARLEDEDEIPGVQVALEFAVIGGRIVDEIEIDAGAVGRGVHLFEGDFLDVDIDLGCGSVR